MSENCHCSCQANNYYPSYISSNVLQGIQQIELTNYMQEYVLLHDTNPRSNCPRFDFSLSNYGVSCLTLEFRGGGTVVLEFVPNSLVNFENNKIVPL